MVVPLARLTCDLLLDPPQNCTHVGQTVTWVLAPGAHGGSSASPGKAADMQVPSRTAGSRYVGITGDSQMLPVLSRRKAAGISQEVQGRGSEPPAALCQPWVPSKQRAGGGTGPKHFPPDGFDHISTRSLKCHQSFVKLPSSTAKESHLLFFFN